MSSLITKRKNSLRAGFQTGERCKSKKNKLGISTINTANKSPCNESELHPQTSTNESLNCSFLKKWSVPRISGKHNSSIRKKVRYNIKKVQELPLILRPHIKIDRSFHEFSTQKSTKSSALLPKTPTTTKQGKENESFKPLNIPTISRNQFVKNKRIKIF